MQQTLFNGKYKTLNLIGSGGMSKVYLAESTSLGTKWAIKAVDKKLHTEFDLLAEPNILKKLNHPSLPRIIDIEEDENNLYIIEDYIDGTSLDRQLKEKKNFDENTVINWAKQLCDVLIYLHNQKPNPIIYRDMKPANIIVDKDNKVKLIDFGIAREFKIDNDSDTTYMGTRGYAAPEQYGTSQSDKRTDIYSLGVTMYHLLTGISPLEPPYELRKLRLIDSNFSEGIEYIVNKCIQNDPINRYQSVEELLYDLNNIHTFNSYYIKQKKIEKTKNIIKAIMLVTSISSILLGTKVMGDEKNEKYENLISNGHNSLNLYNFNEADKYFEEAKNVYKNRADSYLGQAKILLNKNEYEKCMIYLDEIYNNVKDMSKNAQYFYLKGSAHYDNDEYENAALNFEKAMLLDTSNIDYARDLAVSKVKLGQIEYGKNIIETVMNKGNYEDSVYYINGEIALKQGNLYEAIQSFENIIDITKDNVIKKKAYIALSDIYKENRDIIDGAISNQIQILKNAMMDLNNPNDIFMIEALAEAYYANKNNSNSAEQFNRLLELGYERSYIYRNLAIIYQENGNLSDAENILLRMKEKYPDDYTAYLQLAWVYLEKEGKKYEFSRNYDKVLEYHNLAIKFAPQGESSADIMQLSNKINELRIKGWI